jgi:hypothetical protein
MSEDPTRIELDNEVYVDKLINYLSVLQEGRIKPNTNPNATVSTVRDSIDNLPDIEGVKAKLNYVFSIDDSIIENARRNRR